MPPSPPILEIDPRASGPTRPWLADLALLAVPLALFGGMYWRTFLDLAAVWDIDPNYSHGYLVPLCCLVFAALAWRDGGSPIQGSVGWGRIGLGVAEIAFGLLLHAAASFFHALLVDVLSMLFVLRGCLQLAGGSDANRRFGFAVLFLIFMTPLPMSWYQPLALGLQHISSTVSAAVLEAFGVPVFQEGYALNIPGHRMEVGAACSGMRQLIAILALAVAVGHFTFRTSGYRWLLALLAVPIAVIANCIRVVLTGVILLNFDAKFAQGEYHEREGLVVVAVSAVIVLMVSAALSRSEEARFVRELENARLKSKSAAPAEERTPV